MILLDPFPQCIYAGNRKQIREEDIPDRFFTQKEEEKTFVILDSRKYAGMLRYRADGDAVIADLWFDPAVSSENVRNQILWITEYLITKTHSARIIVNAPVQYPALMETCGYYAKGRNMQRLTEKWRLILQDRVFDEYGYIINQGLMRDVPFGWFTTDAKGCGWIAAYNLLKMNGQETPMEECAGGLEKNAFLGKVMGQDILQLYRWLKRRLPVTISVPGNRNAAKAIENSSSGIILYTHKRGAHYTAYRKMKDGKICVYNAVYGRRNHQMTAEHFLKEYPLFPTTIVISIKE